MKKELPHIYKNETVSRAKKNRDVYHIQASDENPEREVLLENDPVSVEAKLKKLFQSRRYIFNIGVEIITKRKVYDTKIAGKVKNSIVTIDGEVIPMIEIEDIIIKDRL